MAPYSCAVAKKTDRGIKTDENGNEIVLAVVSNYEDGNKIQGCYIPVQDGDKKPGEVKNLTKLNSWADAEVILKGNGCKARKPEAKTEALKGLGYFVATPHPDLAKSS